MGFPKLCLVVEFQEFFLVLVYVVVVVPRVVHRLHFSAENDLSFLWLSFLLQFLHGFLHAFPAFG